MKWLGTQSRSASYGVPKISTFTHHNKLTSRIVSKPLIGLTILNQALICTPTPNLMGVIQSELMISQAFQTCYSIEGCPSNCCILSQERVEYMVGNIYQLNLSPILPLTYLRESHLQPQELLRWRQGPKRLSSINLWEIYYDLTNPRTQLQKKEKENSLFYWPPSHLSSMTLPCRHDRCDLSILHIHQTLPCDPAPLPYATLYQPFLSF